MFGMSFCISPAKKKSICFIMFYRRTLKGRPQLADRADTEDHIHKDAIDRYAPCLRALL